MAGEVCGLVCPAWTARGVRVTVLPHHKAGHPTTSAQTRYGLMDLVQWIVKGTGGGLREATRSRSYAPRRAKQQICNPGSLIALHTKEYIFLIQR